MCNLASENNKVVSSTVISKTDKTVVLMIGEDWGADPVTYEVILEYLSKVTKRIVLLVVKRQSFWERSGRGDIPELCATLPEVARQFGIEIECRAILSKNPFEDTISECAKIVEQLPKAIFCFLRWGLEPPTPNLKEKLTKLGYATAPLNELLLSNQREA